MWKTPPFLEKIEDKAEVDRLYRYWRLRIFYSMYIGYGLFYLTRKSYTSIYPFLLADTGLDFTKADLGRIASVFAVTYGLSKMLSGVVSDRSNPRYFMSVGLILTGVLNIIFGLSSAWWVLAVVWGLNGFFQAWGGPPCARLFTHWFSKAERGTSWSLWNTAHNVGGALSMAIGPFIAVAYGWQAALYVPATVCILGGLFLMNRLRDTPRSLGLSTIEEYKNEPPAVGNQEKERLSVKEILLENVLSNRYIWLLAAIYFFVYVVRTGINDWTSLFLIQNKEYGARAAGIVVAMFEFGGIFGALAAGWISDVMYNGRRGPINVLFGVGIFASLLAFWVIPPGFVALDIVAMFALGFFVFGPQMLIGMIPAEICDKKAAGAAIGFVGCFGYLGAAFAGEPLGWMADHYSWQGVFMALLACAAVTTVIMLPLWTIGLSRTAPQKA